MKETEAPKAKKAEAPAAPVAEEPKTGGSVDLGYRWNSSVSGSLDTYRSIVNLGEGPRVAREVFLRPKLRGIHEDGDDDSAARASEFACALDQGPMSRVQRAHRGHEHDRPRAFRTEATGGSYGFQYAHADGVARMGNLCRMSNDD